MATTGGGATKPNVVSNRTGHTVQVRQNQKMIGFIGFTYLELFPDSPPPLEELREQLLLELLVGHLDGAERLVELRGRPLDGLFVDGVLG